MRFFSKTYSFLLAFALLAGTFGQVQNQSTSESVLLPVEDETPAYSGISAEPIWGVINLDGNGSTLLSIESTPDSNEEQKNNSYTGAPKEASLEAFSSMYLLLAKDIACSPSIRELLYPFYFFF